MTELLLLYRPGWVRIHNCVRFPVIDIKWIEMLGNKVFLVLYAGHPVTKCSAFKHCSEKHLNLLTDLYEQPERQKGEWNSLLWVEGINPPTVARAYIWLNRQSPQSYMFYTSLLIQNKKKKNWKGLVALKIWNTRLSSVRHFISGQHISAGSEDPNSTYFLDMFWDLERIMERTLSSPSTSMQGQRNNGGTCLNAKFKAHVRTPLCAFPYK